MMKHGKVIFINIVLCLAISISVAMADDMYRLIEVCFNNIQVYKNGEQIELTDVNGKSTEPFIYNGTTYLPLRAIGENFNYDVEWIEKDNRVELEDTSVRFFPDSLFDNFSPLINSCTEHMMMLGEPSLYNLKYVSQKHIIRFTCLNTWSNPYSIRVEIDSNKLAKMISKRSSGRGGFEPGELLMEDEQKLTALDTKNILDILESGQQLEDLPSFDAAEDVLDGSFWILEELENNEYHAICRYSPTEGKLFDLGTLLTKLSGIVE